VSKKLLIGTLTISKNEKSALKMFRGGTRAAEFCAAMKQSRDIREIPTQGRDGLAYGRVIFSGRIRSSNSFSVR
jgi:hypothetical protein